ncbi:MAG: calcium/sodium antiporter, partial [Rubrobacteraceae bacterium]
IGLTVVAFGTSSPEAAVSVGSALGGQADIALGNVVGSNIFNVLLVLGLSALVAPLVVSRRLVRLDAPLMVGVSVLLLILSLDGSVGRLDGVLLFGGVVAYTLFAVWESRREGAKMAAEGEAHEQEENGNREYGRQAVRNVVVQLGFVVVGLGMLVLGSHWLVDGAVAIASAIGISELIIGLTVVSAGTSLPEVATSVLAVLRGEREMAVGNVVGSCLFNILAVLGLTSFVAPNGVDVASAAISFDIPVMIATAVACLPIFFTGHRINRWEGLIFLGYYVAYTLYLFLDAAGHEALPVFSFAMLAFVIPLTTITLAVLAARSLGRRLRKGV